MMLEVPTASEENAPRWAKKYRKRVNHVHHRLSRMTQANWRVIGQVDADERFRVYGHCDEAYTYKVEGPVYALCSRLVSMLGDTQMERRQSWDDQLWAPRASEWHEADTIPDATYGEYRVLQRGDTNEFRLMWHLRSVRTQTHLFVYRTCKSRLQTGRKSHTLHWTAVSLQNTLDTHPKFGATTYVRITACNEPYFVQNLGALWDQMRAMEQLAHFPKRYEEAYHE